MDFDSAIPRFESSRPSQPVPGPFWRSLRRNFQVWKDRRHSRGLADNGLPHTDLSKIAMPIVTFSLEKSCSRTCHTTRSGTRQGRIGSFHSACEGPGEDDGVAAADRRPGLQA